MKSPLYAVLGLLVLVSVSLTLLVLTSLAHDPFNPRDRPNSYLIRHRTEVDLPVESTWVFMTTRIPEAYTRVTPLHERFEILDGDRLREGVHVDCLEGDARELVHSRYRVTRAVENRLLAMESIPTVVYDRATMEPRARAHTFVYYDFQDLPGHRTRLTQTVVIDMLSPVYKVAADVMAFVTGTRQVWSRQFRDELEGYRRLMEEEMGAGEEAADPGAPEAEAVLPSGPPGPRVEEAGGEPGTRGPGGSVGPGGGGGSR